MINDAEANVVCDIYRRFAAGARGTRLDEIRDALLQRAENWRVTLRAEPQVARVLVRRLIGPLLLYDESTRPEFIRAEAEVKHGLLDGIVPHAAYNKLAGDSGGDVYMSFLRDG